MLGYSNTGYNRTLSGVVKFTDGQGTTIQDGIIISKSLNSNNINSSTITNTGNIIIDGDINGGSNNISEFNDIIFIVSQTSYFDTSNCLGLNTFNNIVISPTVLSYLNGVSSNIQTQINNLVSTTSSTISTNQIVQPSSLSYSNQMNNIILNAGNNLYLNSGNLIQYTSQSNTLGSCNIQSLVLNGNLSTNSNISQSSGSNTLLNTNIGVLTQSNNNYITQIGSTGANNLRQTYISDLVVTNSISIPSGTTISSPTTYTSDIILNNGRIIQTNTTSTLINQLEKTDFIDLVYFDGNITMTNASATCILENATINNSLNIVGNITQTSGTNTFLNTTINNNLNVTNNIVCNTINTSTVSNTQIKALENIT